MVSWRRSTAGQLTGDRSTTALAAIPSPRPVKPMPSVLVAETATQAGATAVGRPGDLEVAGNALDDRDGGAEMLDEGAVVVGEHPVAQRRLVVAAEQRRVEGLGGLDGDEVGALEGLGDGRERALAVHPLHRV